MKNIGIVILCFGVLSFADGIRIKECSDSNWLEIREDNNPSTPITCDEFSANDTITWILFVSGAATGSYTCGPGSQQCVSTDSDVTIRRTNHGTGGSSVLTVVGNHRTKAGKGVVSCRLSRQTSVAIANCNTNVVSPVIVSPCRMTINAEDWTASASCSYDRVYSSNGTYTCTWYQQPPGQSSRYRLLNVNLPTTNQTTTGGKQYYTGDCSLRSFELPVAEGIYVYTVDFVPGPYRHPAGSVTIQIPENPQSSCPHYVYEGQDVQCYCLANSTAPGSPAPVVQWQELQPEEALNIGQVSRNDTGREFYCQLNWGKPNNKLWKTTKYTLKVAYGPDEVMITEDEGAQSSPPSSTLTLQCRAIIVFPSATFTWSGVVCSSTTSDTNTSTCTFPWTPGDDKTMVTCTARNSQFPQRLSSETTETFPVERRSTSTPVLTTSTAIDGCDRGVPLGAVIGGFVVALVVIAVLIVIILVLVRRKRHQVPETSAEESVHADALSETNAAYSSLFEDDLRTGGRNTEPRNRDNIALNNLSVHSPAPPLQRRDEAKTANPYDLVVSVYEIPPTAVPSSSSNVQPSDGRPSAEENENRYIAMDMGQASVRARNMPLTTSSLAVYANDSSAPMNNNLCRGQEASTVLSRAEAFPMELNAEQRENQQREQQTSADYENARPSQQGITHPEEGTRTASNEDYYNTRGICPRPPQSTADGPDNPLNARPSHL